MNNIKNSKWHLQIFEAHVSIKKRELEHCLLFALNLALICAKILAFAFYRKLLLLGICTSILNSVYVYQMSGILPWFGYG